MEKHEILAAAINRGERIEEETHAVGGGEWSIEVYGSESGFLFELVGSNGTRDEEADDLHGELHQIYIDAQELVPARQSEQDVAVERSPRQFSNRRR